MSIRGNMAIIQAGQTARATEASAKTADAAQGLLSAILAAQRETNELLRRLVAEAGA